jgi:hypothetical protein
MIVFFIFKHHIAYEKANDFQFFCKSNDFFLKKKEEKSDKIFPNQTLFLESNSREVEVK